LGVLGGKDGKRTSGQTRLQIVGDLFFLVTSNLILHEGGEEGKGENQGRAEHKDLGHICIRNGKAVLGRGIQDKRRGPAKVGSSKTVG